MWLSSNLENNSSASTEWVCLLIILLIRIIIIISTVPFGKNEFFLRHILTYLKVYTFSYRPLSIYIFSLLIFIFSRLFGRRLEGDASLLCAQARTFCNIIYIFNIYKNNFFIESLTHLKKIIKLINFFHRNNHSFICNSKIINIILDLKKILYCCSFISFNTIFM